MTKCPDADRCFAWNAPAVVCQIIDGEAILIHFERGHYYSVTGCGAWAIELMERGLSIESLGMAFANRFGISRERVLEDLCRFSSHLLAEELVVDRSPDGTPSVAVDASATSRDLDYTPPKLVKYTDLEDLLALDPIHDVIAPAIDPRYAELQRAFERASRTSEVHGYFIELGGRKVSLHFAGKGLFELLTPAFAHLRASPGDAELNLFIADSESTGVTPTLDLETFGEDLMQTAVIEPTALRCTYVRASEMYCCYYPEQSGGFIWVRCSRELQPWDISAPFRVLWGWWAESVGAQLVHGAVVGNEQGAILLGGPSGVGKSTLTLACLRHGLYTLGDDYVWVEPGEPARAFSLYCTAKVDRRVLSQVFANWAPLAHHEEQGKACLYLTRLPGANVTSWLPLRAVAALRFSGQPAPRIRPISAIDVLNALAPSSLRQLTGATLGGLHRLGQIVAQVRPLLFEAGTNHEANAEAIASLLLGHFENLATVPHEHESANALRLESERHSVP